MKKWRVLLLLLLGFSLAAATGGYAKKDRVLIYTRNGKGYVHDNVAASARALTELCRDKGIAADLRDNPSVFSSDSLKRYRAVIFSNTNNEAFDNDNQRNAFVAYIRSGGGFVAIHSACASEREWPWYWALVGGRFVRHPPMQKFTIKVIDRRHPSTAFLGDAWPWEDECYYLDHYNPDIRILLAADLTTVTDAERATYPGVVFGDTSPLAWTHEFEGSRQFFTALGHKIEHYSDLRFRRHLQAGLLWAMKKD
jgi:type 1 glutamine amidotransferase